MDTITDQTSENIDRTVSGLKDGVSAATASLHQAQTALADGVQKMMKTTEELLSFSQGNIEAVTRSSQILSSGVQEIGQTMAASAKTSMDETMAIFKSVAGLKSFKDLFDLQSSYLRSTIERSVSQASQLTETSMKLSERAFAPIAARIEVATRKFGRVG
jgi:phasin family protein